jgi:hypothetical protein
VVQGLSVSGGQLEDSVPRGRQAEFHAGELFPQGGLHRANTQLGYRAVVRFYNKRGFRNYV